MKKEKVEIENPNDVPEKIIADSIIEIAKAMKKISSTRLSRDAIVVLLKDSSGIPKLHINIILDHLENLERHWLKRQ